jgi:uncharacterized protein (TIGR00251 family)
MSRNWLKPYKVESETWVLAVRAKPRASISRIVGISDDGVCINVTLAAPPVDGEANSELVSLFAEVFKLRKKQIEILSGEGSRFKRVVLRGISEAIVLMKVGECCS